MNISLLKNLLIKHEGMQLKPYYDSANKLTIGIGRNLTDVGISKVEAFYLLDNDITKTINNLITIPTFRKLDETRQCAIADMAFNLGFAGVMRFKKMWAAVAAKNYSKAADEMMNSKWALQVGHRAYELAAMIRNGP